MLRYKEVIWDYNGTLVDDTVLCLDIMNETLAAHAMSPITLKEYTDSFTIPIRDYYARLGFDFAIHPYEEVARHFIDSYAVRRFELPLHKGVADALIGVRARGGRNHALSAYNHDALKEMLDFYDITEHFDLIQGIGDHYAAGKIEEGRRLLAAIHAPAKDVVLIGDTIHDFEVAQAIGVDCILVSVGHMSADRLKTCGVFVASSIKEVAERLFH